MRDQRLLAADRLAIHGVATDHLARHREAQRVEGVRRGDRGGVRTQAPADAAVLDATKRRHVPCPVAVHAMHQHALDQRPAVDLRVHAQPFHPRQLRVSDLVKMRERPAQTADRHILVQCLVLFKEGIDDIGHFDVRVEVNAFLRQ